MNKIVSTIAIAVFTVPMIVFAQSADDVILNLLSSLDGPVAAITPTATSAPAAPQAPVAPKPKPAQQAPTPEVLAPLHVFDIESNTQKPDPQIGALKSVLANLLARFAEVASSTPTGGAIASSSAAQATGTSTAAIKKLWTRNLDVGSRGDDVKALQRALIRRGFLFGEPTGYYGILTQTAVTNFQTEQGLPAVGTFGPRTRTLLEKFYEDSQVRQAQSGDQPRPVPPIPAALPFIASSTSPLLSASSSPVGTSSPAFSTSTPVIDPLAPPVSVSMTLLPTEAAVGDTVSVTWLSLHADTCEASDGWSGPKPTIGAAKVGPLQFSLNLVLTCTGAGGVASTTALVVVGGGQ